MLQILELMPLVAFFAAYKLSGSVIELGHFQYHLDGIYGATTILMLATLLQLVIVWAWKRQIEKRMWWLVIAILVFGSATLFFHNQRFIQWKPTIVNWGLGCVLLGSHLLRKNVIRSMLGNHLQLPDIVCVRLTWVWTTYFLLVGALNLLVAYQFSESTWVSYKLWSAVVFTLGISIVTALLLIPYLKVDIAAPKSNEADPTK